MIPTSIMPTLRNLSAATLYAGIKRKLSGDTGTVAGTVVLINLMRIVSSAALTRLLSAEAFGVVGIITSVAVTFALISDIGISVFMLRHKESDDPRFLDEVWTLKLVRSVTLTLLVALLSAPISNYLDKPDLRWAIAFGGLTFLFDGLSALTFMTALRNRQVKRLNKIDLICQVFGVLASIVLAYLIGNYWAILFSNLIGQCFRIWLSYAWFPDARRRIRFSRARTAELWQFSRFITGSTMLTLVISQTDKVVLSKLFPLQVFGLYIIASNLAGAPNGLAGMYVGRILYPRYAQVAREAPETMREVFYAQRLQTSLLYAFAVGGFMACAPLVVTVLYDDRYLPAIVYLQILLINSFFAMGNSSTNEVMLAIGNPKFTFYANVVRLGFLALAGWAAYTEFGVFGLIWAVGLVEFAAQIYAWISLRTLRLLDVPKEAAILGIGVAGFALGWVVNLAGITIVNLL